MTGRALKKKIDLFLKESSKRDTGIREHFGPEKYRLWDEIAERTFKLCVRKQKGGILCAMDFLTAMDYYCMHVLCIYPPRLLAWHGSLYAPLVTLFQKHGFEPVLSFSPEGNDIWAGCRISMPYKWFTVDRTKLKFKEVTKWR